MNSFNISVLSLLDGIDHEVEPFSAFTLVLVQGDNVGMRNIWSAYQMLWRGMGRIMRGEGRFSS